MCAEPDGANDRERLEGAIKRADKIEATLCGDSKLILAAARRHLDTLPPHDIVKRLRAAKVDDRLSTGALYGEAAAEIERLRKGPTIVTDPPWLKAYT